MGPRSDRVGIFGADLLHVGGLIDDGAPGLELGWRHVSNGENLNRSIRVAVDRVDGRIRMGRSLVDLPFVGFESADALGVPIRLTVAQVKFEDPWIDGTSDRGRFVLTTPITFAPVGFSNSDQGEHVAFESSLEAGLCMDGWTFGTFAANLHVDGHGRLVRRFENGSSDLWRAEVQGMAEGGLGFEIDGQAWTLALWAEHLLGFRFAGGNRGGSAFGVRIGTRSIPDF